MIYRIIKLWVLLSFVATASCGLVYLAVQQSLRQGANDPQIQMAEDAAAASQSGTPVRVPSGTVNIAESLAPYIVVFDAAGNPVAGNGRLSEALPHLPPGVFSYVGKYGEDRFTWQPAPGVREAVVVDRLTGGSVGFVMAGRSLREVEIREHQTLTETEAAWLATVVGLGILCAAFAFIDKKIAAL
jgi:hypothetical protein